MPNDTATRARQRTIETLRDLQSRLRSALANGEVHAFESVAAEYAYLADDWNLNATANETLHTPPEVAADGRLRLDLEFRRANETLKTLDASIRMLADVAAQEKRVPSDNRTVIVVHGRNHKVRDWFFAFLRAIDLRPIEFPEAISLTGKASPTIPETISTLFEAGRAVLVLLTGDDVARLRDEFIAAGDGADETSLTPQARPNVLFEAGMAFGLHPDRTILIEIGAMRRFSDIAGRHTIRFSGSATDRHSLVSRLRIAGCEPVTEHRQDWLRIPFPE